MKGHKSIAAYCYVFFLAFPGSLMTELLDNSFFSASQELLTSAEGQKTNHFKFKSRKIGEKMITVVSLKLDPERGRRSILVPDGEGLLHPASFAHLRHPHRFIPPFEDVEQLPPFNKSINWGDPVGPPPKKLTSLEELEAIEEKTNKVLEEIETSLTHIEESLEEEKEKERKAQREERKNNKNRKDKDNSNRKKRKEEKRENKLKMKERRRENKSEKGTTEKRKQNRKSDKSRQKMVGNEACQYKMLRKCAKKLSLLPRKAVQVYSDFQKCSHRKRFLECVEKRREKKSCKARTVARGNLSGLRTWLKKAFWTANSCLLNEALKGR